MLTKVLLVDDSVTIHRVIDLSINLEKFEITKVFTKEEATSKLSQNRYDCILLDNKLDNVHIIDYIKELKTSFPYVRIVLLVGAFDRFSDADLKITSADDFLVKPFDSQTLNSKLLATPPITENIASQNKSNDTLSAAEILENNRDINDAINEDISRPEEDDFLEDLKLEDLTSQVDLEFENIAMMEKLTASDDSNKHVVAELPVDNLLELDDDDEVRKSSEELLKKDEQLEPDEIIDDEIATNQLLDMVLSDADAGEEILKVDSDFELPDVDMPEIDITEIVFPQDDTIKLDEDISTLSATDFELEFVDDPSAISEVSKLLADESFDMDDLPDIDDSSMKAEAMAEELLDAGAPALEHTPEPKAETVLPAKKPLTYLELEKVKAPKEEDFFDDGTVHKELVGNVLYEEVMMPALSGKEVAIETVKKTITDTKPKAETETPKVVDETAEDPRELLYNLLKGVISKELIEESIRAVLAKNIEEAVKDIIPTLAEKYILEEIERLKEDEKED